MRKINLFIAFLLLVNFGFSQNSFHRVNYNSLYTSQISVNDNLNNIYLTGEELQGKIVFSKFDTQGNFKWGISLGDSLKGTYPMDLILHNDTLLVAVCRFHSVNYGQLMVVGMDTSGQIKFLKLLGDTINKWIDANKILATSSGFIITSDYIDQLVNTKGHIAKFDYSGNLLWEKGLDNFSYNSIQLLPDGTLLLGDFFMAGLLHTNLSLTLGTYRAYLFDSDSSPFTCLKSVRSNTNKLCYLGFEVSNGILVTLDTSLNYYQAIRYYSANMDDYVALLDIKQLPSGGWIVLGNFNYLGNNFESRLFLMKLNSNFAPISSVLLPDTFYVEAYYLNYIISLNSLGNVSVTSSKYLNMALNRFDLFSIDSSFSNICGFDTISFLVSMDSLYEGYSTNVNIYPMNSMQITPNLQITNLTYSFVDCSTLINNVENVEDEFIYTLFPNPTKDYINLKVIDEVQFQVINDIGEEVMKGKLSSAETKINLLNLDNGFYFLRLLSNEKIINRRFIKY